MAYDPIIRGTAVVDASQWVDLGGGLWKLVRPFSFLTEIAAMGCDIHIKIEKRVDENWVDVPWTSGDARKYHNVSQDGVEMPDYFDNRNYNLFAVLADVRNGTWGERLTPISQPRDLDRSTDARFCEPSHTEWLGDHSFSHVTLKELQDYPWDSPYRYAAYVSHEQAKEMQETGKPPESWAGGMSRGVRVSWVSTIRHAVHEWPDDVLPILATIGAPEGVRLVFGFDS